MPYISDYKVNRIKELGAAGLTASTISKDVGVSIPTTHKYLKTATKSKKTVVAGDTKNKDMVFSYNLDVVEGRNKESWNKVTTAQDLADAIQLIKKFGFTVEI